MLTNHTSFAESYDVRRFGCTAWATGLTTFPAARKEAERAKQVTGLEHHVFAVDLEGERHGPLDERLYR